MTSINTMHPGKSLGRGHIDVTEMFGDPDVCLLLSSSSAFYLTKKYSVFSSVHPDTEFIAGYVSERKKKVSFQIIFLKSEKSSVVVGCVH